ncbi:hypothetical protein BKA93DRAFT_764710 [Sparassis latifolia]
MSCQIVRVEPLQVYVSLVSATKLASTRCEFGSVGIPLHDVHYISVSMMANTNNSYLSYAPLHIHVTIASCACAYAVLDLLPVHHSSKGILMSSAIPVIYPPFFEEDIWVGILVDLGDVPLEEIHWEHNTRSISSSSCAAAFGAAQSIRHTVEFAWCLGWCVRSLYLLTGLSRNSLHSIEDTQQTARIGNHKYQRIVHDGKVAPMQLVDVRHIRTHCKTEKISDPGDSLNLKAPPN